MSVERSGPLALPEIAHMLSVMTGAQAAMNELMAVAKKEKDPSIIRLCVSEAENISKTATRLAQSMSAWEAENPGQVRRNDPVRRDPGLDDMRDQFLDILRSFDLDHELDEHVENLRAGAWRESDYSRVRDHVLTPLGTRISVRDWLEILDLYRGLNEAERHDFNALSGVNYE